MVLGKTIFFRNVQLSSIDSSIIGWWSHFLKYFWSFEMQTAIMKLFNFS